MLKAGEVSEVTFDSNVIYIKPKSQKSVFEVTYYTGYVQDTALVQDMLNKYNVDFSAKIDDTSSGILSFLLAYILPFAGMWIVLWLLMRMMSRGGGGGGIMGVGKSTAKMYVEKKTGVTLQNSFLPENFAQIRAFPGFFATTFPLEFTEATDFLVERHTIFLVVPFTRRVVLFPTVNVTELLLKRGAACVSCAGTAPSIPVIRKVAAKASEMLLFINFIIIILSFHSFRRSCPHGIILHQMKEKCK